MNDENERKFRDGQYVIFRNAIWQITGFFIDSTIRGLHRGRYEITMIMHVPLTDPADVYHHKPGETDTAGQWSAEGKMKGQSTESQFRAIDLLEVCQARKALDEFAIRLASSK